MVKNKIDNTGAYTRYDYANTGNAVTSYSTIIDVNNDTYINTSDEVATESVFDGAGRLLKTRTANPNSTGGYTGKKVEYDLLGRAFRETVPTEMNSGWNPAGDDYRSNTWLWNTREFDWKGRVIRSIPSDSTGSDGKDTLMSYEGCGCAGGMITTIQGPVTTAIDVAGNIQTTKRRTQKTYADILGRTVRTELWDLDGAGSAPYSTVRNTYNGRDQITLIEEFVGGTTGTHQDTTISYDGHGRTYQVHKPEFDSGKYTTTTYNADDSVATVTDPRDAVTTYTYGIPTTSEKRAVVTAIAYSVPSGSNIPDPSDVSFTYDAAGNRTEMTDGLGTVAYVYDELSRLKSESRNFTDTLANEPSTGVYKLEYAYSLSGLKSYKDPFGESVTYTHDSVGRTTQVGASAFTGRTTSTGAFATSLSYRAFGAIKSVNFATDTTTYVNVDYDTALRPTSYEATSSANTDDIHDRGYEYYNDGMLKETTNAVDAKFSQKNEYDFAGRLKKNDFGNTTVGVPYKQTISYDTYSNITARSTWDKDNNLRSYTAGFTNNRKSSGGFQNGTDTFDAAGRVTLNHYYNGKDNDKRWTFDAGGRMTEWLETSPYATTYWDEGATITFDGDGRAVKKRNRNRNRANGNTTFYEENAYEIISSVLGKTITSVNNTGAKTKTNVYLGSSVMAEQTIEGSNTFVSFKHIDPLTGSRQATDASGEIIANDAERIELDPIGTWVNPSEADLQTPVDNYKHGGDMGNPDMGCSDPDSGTPMPCNVLGFLLRSGAQFYSDAHYLDEWYKRQVELGRIQYAPPTLPSDYIGADNRGMGAGDGSRGTKYKGLLELGPWSEHSGVEWFVMRIGNSSPPFPDVDNVETKKFPCPLPWLFGGILGKGYPQVTNTLVSAVNDAKANKREEGGWIYMNRKGQVKAVRKVIDADDKQAAIQLSFPEYLKGWIVIATFHTHDISNEPSESVPGFVVGDTDVNEKFHKVPGLILGTKPGNEAWTRYGPERGFFGVGLPDRCK